MHEEIEDVKQAYALLFKENATLRARVKELGNILRDMLDNVDEPPEANCSCHRSPPCNDCVDYSCAREAFASARAALKETQ